MQRVEGLLQECLRNSAIYVAVQAWDRGWRLQGSLFEEMTMQHSKSLDTLWLKRMCLVGSRGIA